MDICAEPQFALAAPAPNGAKSAYGNLLSGDDSMLGHGGRQFHCGFHIGRIRLISSRDVEGGSMVDRRANDWQAKRYIHCILEVNQFHGDMPLIVIHRDD